MICKSMYYSMSQKVVRDVSSMWHGSTPYDSYQNILPRTMITVVLIGGFSFSAVTIVIAESSHIHCFNPINLYPLIGYNRIINQNMSVTQYSKYPLLYHNVSF